MTAPFDDLFISFQTALAGRYSLERELGRGGMGVVYLAREVSLDRSVALKLLPPALAAQPSLRERFLREARTAAKLSHPNVVPIYAVDEVGGFVFFTMAYVEGGTLSQRVRERGPLTPAAATRLLSEVAWALAYAHAQGVVHRDIKPDNILIENSGRALVTDFGIAHLGRSTGITEVGEVLGTAEFMSPEQASGSTVDPRSDLYSLGVVAYYALSGRLPFEGASVQAVLAQHITQPAPALRDVAPGAPHKLAQVVARSLAKEPSERFETGEAMAAAIAGATQERNLPARLRVFLRQDETLGPELGPAAYAGIVLTPVALVGLLSGLGITPPGPIWVVFGVVSALLAVFPFATRMMEARRLLKDGYGLEDVRIGILSNVERRREEVALAAAKPTFWERALRLVTWGGVAGAAAAVINYGVEAFWFSMNAALLGGVSATAISQFRRGAHLDRWTAFWNGRAGEFLFRLAGRTLTRSQVAAHATHRPTELAIGLAAESLFAKLPKETRRALGGLPEAVQRLQADARRMRAHIESLNELVADASGPGAPSSTNTGSDLAERRRALTADLTTTRDAAQQRLASAVAALETIRLDLLRLHGGVGSIASITADLSAAREAGEQIGRLLEGHREIEQALRPATGPTIPDTKYA